MKAVRLHAYHEDPVVEEVPNPRLSSPLDVIVKVGGAGVCRTDLHIIEGQWEALQHPRLPYTIGHENAGWVHEVGSAVTNVAVGDTVILHPQPSCGLCLACRSGHDMQCDNAFFPGLSDHDGGMAEYLLTSERACVKLDPKTEPADVAALADAGITAYHAVRKAIPLLPPGSTCVVVGAGGLGHIGIQCLKALTATRVVVVDPNPAALDLARDLGADETVLADGSQVEAVTELTGGAQVVLDFVAEQGAENQSFAMTRPGGSCFVIGYGGQLQVPTLDMVSTERSIIGNLVGTWTDLAEVMALAESGRVRRTTHPNPPCPVPSLGAGGTRTTTWWRRACELTARHDQVLTELTAHLVVPRLLRTFHQDAPGVRCSCGRRPAEDSPRPDDRRVRAGRHVDASTGRARLDPAPAEATDADQFARPTGCATYAGSDSTSSPGRNS